MFRWRVGAVRLSGIHPDSPSGREAHREILRPPRGIRALAGDASSGRPTAVGRKVGITTTNSWDTVSPSQVNFPEDRYHEYVALLKEVGGYWAARRLGEPAGLEIQIWRWGFAGTAHNISICWDRQAPTNQVPNLAGHVGRRSPDGRQESAYRLIEGN